MFVKDSFYCALNLFERSFCFEQMNIQNQKLFQLEKFTISQVSQTKSYKCGFLLG